MLIGFSGPSGSGKTTLVNKLAEVLRSKGHDVGVVEEVARQVFRRYSAAYGFESLSELRKSEMLLPFQFDVLKEQVRQEDEALEKHSIVLTDRTIYDNLFFTIPAVYDCDYDLLEEYFDLFKRAETCEFTRQWRYDLVFFCKPLGTDVDDGFRTHDIRYREFQELVIYRLIPFTQFVTIIEEVPLEERLDLCMKEIEHIFTFPGVR